MKIKNGNVEQFKSLSQFVSLKEFNTHLEIWLSKYKRSFTKSELVGLKRLARFAAKVPGVCNAKIGTVLKATYEEYNGNGISRSTFKRMIGKASMIGIFTVHETERKNGSQSSNLYVFNRFPNIEPPKEKILDQAYKTSNLSKTKINKENNKRNESAPLDSKMDNSELDHTFTSDRVPTSFVKLVKCFFPNAKTIEEFWRMTKIAAYKNDCEQQLDTLMELAIHSFKQLISKMKTSKVTNPIAYYYGILDNKLLEVYFEELNQISISGEKEYTLLGY